MLKRSNNKDSDSHDDAPRWNRQDWYSILNIVSPITVVLFVILFNRDSETNRRLTDISYKVNATQFRPIIKFVGSPKLIVRDSLQLHGTYKKKRLILDSTLYQKADSVFVDLDIYFRIANTGSAIAKLHSLVQSSDSIAGSRSLRGKLLSKAFQHDRDSLSYIFPGDTLTIYKHIYAEVMDDSFTLHFFMLYENETDALYDTYYWAQYRMGILNRIKAYPNNTVRFVLIKNHDQNVYLVKDYLSTNLYSIVQADSIRLGTVTR